MRKLSDHGYWTWQYGHGAFLRSQRVTPWTPELPCPAAKPHSQCARDTPAHTPLACYAGVSVTLTGAASPGAIMCESALCFPHVGPA